MYDTWYKTTLWYHHQLHCRPKNDSFFNSWRLLKSILYSCRWSCPTSYRKTNDQKTSGFSRFYRGAGNWNVSGMIHLCIQYQIESNWCFINVTFPAVIAASCYNNKDTAALRSWPACHHPSWSAASSITWLLRRAQVGPFLGRKNQQPVTAMQRSFAEAYTQKSIFPVKGVMFLCAQNPLIESFYAGALSGLSSELQLAMVC